MFSTISRLRRRNSDDNERGTADPLLDNPTNPRPVQSTGYLNDIRIILCSSYINLLLIFLPFALISGARESSATVVFTTNFLALMALASLLSFSTERLSKKIGQGIGGLLNVTFGNVTELIVGIVALRAGQVKLIQTTMLGSILSSLLFVFSHLLLVIHKLGAWGNFYSRRDADSRLYVQ
jgi:Ca2+:H+ antiporter